MGYRQLPDECDHGRVMDWGDFGPDPDDGSVGAQECPECDAELEASMEASRRAVADRAVEYVVANLMDGSADGLLTVLSADLAEVIRESVLYAMDSQERTT